MRASTRDRPGEVSRSAFDHLCAEMVREAFRATRAGAARGDAGEEFMDDAADWMRRVDGETARAACDRLELVGFRIGERAYLALHAGIVRGGLKSFGITARVRGELRASPSSASRDARRRPARPGFAFAPAPSPAVAFVVDVARPSRAAPASRRL